MAVAVLSEDAELYSQARDLFHNTTGHYMRWGRYGNYTQGYVLGWTSETGRCAVCFRNRSSCFGV